MRGNGEVRDTAFRHAQHWFLTPLGQHEHALMDVASEIENAYLATLRRIGLASDDAVEQCLRERAVLPLRALVGELIALGGGKHDDAGIRPAQHRGEIAAVRGGEVGPERAASVAGVDEEQHLVAVRAERIEGAADRPVVHAGGALPCGVEIGGA